MSVLNIGLVGCGRIAKRHSDILGEGLVQDARLASVCDIRADRARDIGERFQVPWYQDMHEMVRSHPLDVCVVLTESGMHA